MIFGIKELNCKPIYINVFLKFKIKFYGDEATDVRTRKITDAGFNYIYWLVILIDSVL